MKRYAGVLLPVTSLPSKYGIGCFDQAAYDFVDWLQKAGQRYWQILPLGATSYGSSDDSPYQAYSAFAGNPYLISLDTLVEEGVLTREECDGVSFGGNPAKVDFDKLHEHRFALLRKAYERSGISADADYQNFIRDNGWWLNDYALFMALKTFFHDQPFRAWPEDIRMHWGFALEHYNRELYFDIEFQKYMQFKFNQQWSRLKAYANGKHIQIVGDIPIYVSPDGADVWAHPELFQLDERRHPEQVAGCPPDSFTADGQLWGNPLYNWKKHTETGYAWWIERIKYQLTVTDFLRIDHFRGFDRYWAVPYGEETAINGEWKPAPGLNFFTQLEANLGYHLPIIAEDLGEIDDSVIELRDKFGLPGMKILQFAFENPNENDFLPHNYTPNCVCYTGTHDNDTTLGWYTQAYEASKDKLRRYYSTDASDICWVMIRACFSSVANMAIVPMQDVLKLDSWARMNTPGVGEGNWAWRFKASDLGKQLSDRLLETSKLYGRYTPIPEKKDSEEK